MQNSSRTSRRGEYRVSPTGQIRHCTSCNAEIIWTTTILAELKVVAQNNKLRQKDIMEWQTGKSLKAQDGETLYYLPSLGVSVAVKVTMARPNE